MISLHCFKLEKRSNVLKMSGFTLLQLEGVDNDNMTTRDPAVEIGKVRRLTFEWDEMLVDGLYL